ncbi:MAG: hypothetical protein DLM59_14570 [Pseudonocardiales bacterium]|nr:MAG: hypothetical protein DLM59_14570 [Pseudonocardiales bacterium]
MLSRLQPRLSGSHARRFRRRAREYAAHQWPVAALAVPRLGRCPCERGDCIEPHLLDGTTINDPEQAEETWADHGWGIALITSRFDIVDLPARYGAFLHEQLNTRCPTATVPHDRRWHFVMEPGSVDADLVAAAGGVLHSGPDDWIAASPTRIDAGFRIGWIVPPVHTQWRAYRRSDAVGALLLG